MLKRLTILKGITENNRVKIRNRITRENKTKFKISLGANPIIIKCALNYLKEWVVLYYTRNMKHAYNCRATHHAYCLWKEKTFPPFMT
jgi:hypothetical protein